MPTSFVFSLCLIQVCPVCYLYDRLRCVNGFQISSEIQGMFYRYRKPNYIFIRDSLALFHLVIFIFSIVSGFVSLSKCVWYFQDHWDEWDNTSDRTPIIFPYLYTASHVPSVDSTTEYSKLLNSFKSVEILAAGSNPLLPRSHCWALEQGS